MKNKAILSLVMAAAVTLGGAAMATNANFNAVATSAGNTFTMGTVQLQRGGEQAGQSIQMNKLFDASNMVFDKEQSTTTSINIRGSLPVKLSAEVTGLRLPWGENYVPKNGNVDGHFEGALTNYFKNSVGENAKWWRHYKMSVYAVVTRDGQEVTSQISRNTSFDGGYDSFFDTLSGADHNSYSDNRDDTKGISKVLEDLGTLQPGDVVTITTKMKLVSDIGDGHGNSLGTLTNTQQNVFQGQSIGANINIVATDAVVR